MTGRGVRIGTLAVLLSITPLATAAAASGTYTRGEGVINYFYGRSSGSGQSFDFTGATLASLCLDAPGSNAQTMVVGELKENRTLALDPTLRQLSAYYRDPERKSSAASLSTSRRYYAYAAWNYTSADGSNGTGYSSRC